MWCLRPTRVHMVFYWCCYCCWCIPFLLGINGQNQGDLPLKQAVNVRLEKLRHYEIIYPIEIQSTHTNNSLINSKHFQITAFGESYDIFIDDAFNSDEAQVYSDKLLIQYLNSNNTTYQGKYFDRKTCLYHGTLKSNASIKVVMNYCNGLEGVIETENHTLFIEPIKKQSNNSTLESIHRKHIAYRSYDIVHDSKKQDRGQQEPVNDPRISSHRRQRRSGYQSYLNLVNRAGRKVQIYYYDNKRTLIPFIHLLPNEQRGINTFENTEWVAKDDKTHAIFHLNDRNNYVSSVNSPDKRVEIVISVPVGTEFETFTETNQVEGDDYHVEVLVVADKSMLDYHGKANLEKYILTMMGIADDIFKHKSLGAKLHFSIVKILCLESDDVGFSVYDESASRTLRSACEFTTSLWNADENHPDHFDVALAMTRKNFGPSGYAQMYSMCTQRRSCALINDEGLTSAFIVAHEIAHLLGLDHDGENEASGCKSDGPRGSVMAPIIVARYDRFHWSPCSREVMRDNLEFFTCLSNNPKDRVERISNRLPGSFYTIDEQCQLTFGRTSTACTTFGFDPCERLWCSSTSRRCITQRSPALDGTVCGKNRYCSKGRCKEEENNRTKFKHIIVNGEWSQWTAWTGCSQTCGIGLRYRHRQCDSPKPGPGGKGCAGKSKETDICSTQACKLTKSYVDLLQEQCSELENSDYTVYFDQDFDIRLSQPRNNLNCSFEEGICNWKQDRLKNDHNWILQSGRTQSIDTGPHYDHTRRNSIGTYIYMEASSTHTSSKYAGDVARLISRVVQVPRICFSMYYHMYGKDMGSLRINVRFANGTESNKWNVSGNQGNSWRNVKITMEVTQDFQVIIEAIRGEHWAGDIAVDDITVRPGLCPTETKRSNPCKVSCRSRNARSFVMDRNVRDGVHCNQDPRSNNICLNGQCVGFGCDNKFGSGLSLDNCGICGGNGSSCFQKRGIDNITADSGEYKVLMTLLKGSTFFNFTDTVSRSHLYGARKTGTTAIELSYKRDDYFNIDDVTFHFHKDQLGRQVVRTKGPTNCDLDIMIYTQAKDTIQFQYEYFENNIRKYTYEWRIMRWETCSQTCGTGKQRSIADCIRQEDGTKMFGNFCKGLKRPSYMRVCRMKPCPQRFIWIARSWGRCSKSCGNGLQLRKVNCVRAQDNAIAPLSRCTSKRMPKTRQDCNTHACPKNHVWKAQEWNECSHSCGGGFQTRMVVCTEEDTGLIVNEEKCEKTKPDVAGPCNLHPCESFMWRIMNENTKCSKTCGGGIKIVIVNCVKEKDPTAIVDNEYCDGPSPNRLKYCNKQICPEYVWKIIEESPCTVSCGLGTRTQLVRCVDKGTGVEVNDKHCQQQNKPDNIVPCNERHCASYKIAYSAWEDCDVMCGDGHQKRNPYCITDDYKRVVNSTLCGREAKRKEERICQKSICASPADLKCSFTNKNLCQWQNAQNGDFDWSIGKSTPSLNTGPDRDHTTRNGYFAYIETSRPRREGDRAMLVSPVLRAEKGCLIFWYHMRGRTLGRLRLYLATNGANTVLFEKSGFQSKKWLLGRISVNSTMGTTAGYKFMFEAVTGYSAYGDIALDDLSFYDQPCDNLDVVHNPIVNECREISPVCKQKDEDELKRYCRGSDQFSLLCCSACVKYLS